MMNTSGTYTDINASPTRPSTGPTRRITPTGPFDASAAPDLRPILQRLAQSQTDVEIECSHVTRLDPSGLGALVYLHKRLHQQGRRLRLTGLHGQPRSFLEELKLTSVLAN